MRDCALCLANYLRGKIAKERVALLIRLAGSFVCSEVLTQVRRQRNRLVRSRKIFEDDTPRALRPTRQKFGGRINPNPHCCRIVDEERKLATNIASRFITVDNASYLQHSSRCFDHA